MTEKKKAPVTSKSAPQRDEPDEPDEEVTVEDIADADENLNDIDQPTDTIRGDMPNDEGDDVGKGEANDYPGDDGPSHRTGKENNTDEPQASVVDGPPPPPTPAWSIIGYTADDQPVYWDDRDTEDEALAKAAELTKDKSKIAYVDTDAIDDRDAFRREHGYGR